MRLGKKILLSLVQCIQFVGDGIVVVVVVVGFFSVMVLQRNDEAARMRMKSVLVRLKATN